MKKKALFGGLHFGELEERELGFVWSGERDEGRSVGERRACIVERNGGEREREAEK